MPPMSRPVIGITCSRSVSGQWSGYSLGHFMDFAFDAYSQGVLSCGGAPLLVPISQNRRSLEAVCNALDGLILSGGPDVNPRLYKEEPHTRLKDVDEAQDIMEIELTRMAMDSDIPILGICRGQQILNVAMGGTLYQDISSQVTAVTAALNHSPRADRSIVTHKIEIKQGTRLYSIFKRRTLWVNSQHHQAVKDPAPDIVVSAVAADGVIEAIEVPCKSFVVAVQWHPEGLWPKDVLNKRLFSTLVKMAAKRRS